jgi:hypothetical protein
VSVLRRVRRWMVHQGVCTVVVVFLLSVIVYDIWFVRHSSTRDVRPWVAHQLARLPFVPSRMATVYFPTTDMVLDGEQVRVLAEEGSHLGRFMTERDWSVLYRRFEDRGIVEDMPRVIGRAQVAGRVRSGGVFVPSRIQHIRWLWIAGFEPDVPNELRQRAVETIERDYQLPRLGGAVEDSPYFAVESTMVTPWLAVDILACLTTLWMPIAGTVVVRRTLRWCRRLRHGVGHCPRCCYDLRGLESVRCPECGSIPPPTIGP